MSPPLAVLSCVASLTCVGFVAVPVLASEDVSGLVVDGGTIRISVSGDPGSWQAYYVPFAERTEQVEYTRGATHHEFAAGDAGGVYLPGRATCVAEAPFTEEDDGWIALHPEWLPAGQVATERFQFGGGFCGGQPIRGLLFVLGGTVAWRYASSWTLEDVTLLAPIAVGGDDMRAWSMEVATLGADEPDLTQASFNVTVDAAGWLHAELHHDTLEVGPVQAHVHGGNWTGAFPSGRTTTRPFMEVPTMSFSGLTAMGGFHEPAGEARMTVDMASLDPGARIFFAHIPGLLDEMPFRGTDYEG